MNSVFLVGNLTRDPELHSLQNGMSVCDLRIAVSERFKQADGSWGDRSNYFNVTVFGHRAETAAQWLSKGRKIGVSGRLRWQEWETQDGQKRQSVSVIAHDIEFLSPKSESDGTLDSQVPYAVAALDATPINTDDDIPF